MGGQQIQLLSRSEQQTDHQNQGDCNKQHHNYRSDSNFHRADMLPQNLSLQTA